MSRGLHLSVYPPGPQFTRLRNGTLWEADTYTSKYNAWHAPLPGGQPGLSLGQKASHSCAWSPLPPSPGGWMLKMTRAQERDRGLYSCLASNEAGEVQRNFSVEVLGMSPPHSRGHPPILSLQPGSFWRWGLAPAGGRSQALFSLPHQQPLL